MHGGDIYRQHVDLDFSVCLNPLGMPVEAVRGAMRGVALAGTYPDPEARDLKAAIAAHFGGAVDTRDILPGNGACELIYLFAGAVLEEGDEVLVPGPTFSEYGRAAGNFGGRIRHFPLGADNGFAYPGQLEQYLTPGTKLVFLCNPNNPTGTPLPPAVLWRLVQACGERGIRICVDESFLPFSDREEELTAVPLVRGNPHVAVLRAFTKIYSMAGLRLGYLLTSDRQLAARMGGRLQPWNLSVPATLAGIAALSAGPEYIGAARSLVRREKEKLREALLSGPAGAVYGEEGNFLLFTARPDLKRRLLERGILIRSFSREEGLPETVDGENGSAMAYFRIGIRMPEDNDRLVRELRQCPVRP